MGRNSGGIRSEGTRWAVAVRPTPSERISSVINEIRSKGYSTAKPFTVGKVERRMSRYAAANGITLGSDKLYMSATQIAHALRDTKTIKGLAVSDRELASFPKARLKMDLYCDGECFIYTDYRTKYIIHPNYEMKINRMKTRKVNFVTAGKVTDKDEFKHPRYVRVK